jgi:hypothetical protein
MSDITVLISRDGLPGNQDDLALTSTCSGSYVIGDEGFFQPQRIPITTVETNMFLDGGLPTGLRLDVAEFGFRVLVLGNSRQQLENRIENLMEAVSEQLIFTLTVTIGNATPRIWNAYAGPVSLDSSGRNVTADLPDGSFFEQLVVTVPVQPRSS